MHKLLTGLAAASAFALLASSGQACDFHAKHVTASVPSEEVVAMSTVGGTTPPVVVVTDQTVETAAATECPADEECAPADE